MGTEIVERDTSTAVAATSNSTSLLQAIAAAASNPQTDIEKMERLFAMHEAMVKREAEEAFNAALARAQARIIPVANNATNTQTNSTYAKLAEINKAITPIITDEGFGISFDTADSPKQDHIRIVATLSHRQGHSRQYHIDLPPDEAGAKGTINKTRVHAAGSTNSYGRRYLVCMIFNVTTEDDTDGNTQRKVLPDKAKQELLDLIPLCETMGQWESLWSDITKATTAAGDVPAHDELRQAMAVRRKELLAAKAPA